ncbi:hypothetical protein OSB04_011641 [Centaurea solstitialis]|uniref:Uncharacterized protein n=1 Tax=Centaurea solstitialis TaxID=347529 RepID=A0AA38WDV7_9ASTR|nr:hypothetical protein OSB04_011641 [Centaurea solstitialis]
MAERGTRGVTNADAITPESADWESQFVISVASQATRAETVELLQRFWSPLNGKSTKRGEKA